jgi:hypothetical protein
VPTSPLIIDIKLLQRHAPQQHVAPSNALLLLLLLLHCFCSGAGAGAAGAGAGTGVLALPSGVAGVTGGCN